MGLLTDEDIKNIPSLYTTENDIDPVAHVKFFTPDGSWSWYVLEYGGDEKLCFGYVDGFERELGYFSIEELESVRGGLGLSIERDMCFLPMRLSEIKKLHYDR
jgi:hypothetical protein